MRPAFSTRTPLLHRCSIHGLKYCRRRERVYISGDVSASQVINRCVHLQFETVRNRGRRCGRAYLCTRRTITGKQIGQQRRDMSRTHRTWPRRARGAWTLRRAFRASAKRGWRRRRRACEG
ncbi:uncharacterized protein LAESUDRAFT_244594 [Laetiporus sulphureus 93-53]|uniref:Uncharacterized protein n=1 Tax=Laetiporus sulphureus 93-53 TaxID=1314785 RepID=A0A165DGZ7_9APHY|nr:uncharacterized protein LAESUDRAFT_244594 [Laetiporus sulphureus 93-53]KZT04857.1 hypothetical protein LAESUDRAFT_244594 [Laetiporus sulphureus 93-53]